MIKSILLDTFIPWWNYSNANEYHENSLDDTLSTICKAMKGTKTNIIDDIIPSMCNLTQYSKEITDTPPWIRDTDWLFVSIRPSWIAYRDRAFQYIHDANNHWTRSLRAQVVKCIESLALQLWPTARVEAFGSYWYGMFLPGSDIDLDVSGVWDQLPLRAFEAKLLASNIAELNSIIVIEKSTVPIIELVDHASKLSENIRFYQSL